MTDPRISLKNPFLAAFLAFLLPGAGHFYQGRLFKAGIYSVCILGTFFCGMALGEWHPVYHRWDAQHTHYGYVSQFMVGLPALPAWVQSRRLQRQNVQDRQAYLTGELTTPLMGEILSNTPDIPRQIVEGDLTLTPRAGEMGGRIEGVFEGQTVPEDEGSPPVPIKLVMTSPALGPEIDADKYRLFEARIVSINDEKLSVDVDANLNNGAIPRSFWNWFQVPLNNSMLERLHGTLGKQFDLALVFTWIAGLLNVLAIWDAYEGPAYGYGDEEPEDLSSDAKNTA